VTGKPVSRTKGRVAGRRRQNWRRVGRRNCHYHRRVATGAERTSDLELGDYLRVLRRRKLVIALVVAVVVAAALVSSFLQKPVYRAKAEVLLQPRTTESLFDPSSGARVDPVRALETEIQVIKSEPVRAAAQQKLGTAAHVSVGGVGQTDVIQISSDSTSPARAEEVANAYATSYVDFKRKQAVDDILAASQEVQTRVDDLQRQIDALSAQVAGASVTQRPVVEQNLSPSRDALVNQQALFRSRLSQLQVDAALKTGGAQLVTKATTPSSPFKPTPARNGLIALVVGTILGVALAFVIERLDDSIKDKEDLERVTQGLPTLGLVPIVNAWKTRERAELVSLTDPSSSTAEAYRSLRTAVQFMGLDRPMHTVQVTSPSAAEGKTTTLANLAVALSRAGQRVVMVDCDLRRPRIHDFFGLSNEVGFTSVLLGEIPLGEAVQEIPGERYLMLLASGMLPPNPSELLASQRTVQVMAALQAECDVVLFDSPPVLPVTDATVLSSRVDATLLVTRAGVTGRHAAARAVEVLTQVDAPLVGTVLNALSGDSVYAYTYGYRYYQQPTGKPGIPSTPKR
jgi:succinoglycan biosynthesis transport protein ExoP